MKGNIGVTSKDIFPLIKKFMYNDHDIFIREIVSNAIDATQKLNTLFSTGINKPEDYNSDIHVIVNKDDKVIIVRDSGIGMTDEELDKYINQIAFSGANDFLEKYSDTAIIGHFGLGFYSSFMVSDKVEIITKSYNSDKAYKWTCEGTTEFSIEETEKESIGTDIIMHISDKFSDDYLSYDNIKELLKKFSRFSPINIYVEDNDEQSEKINLERALWLEQPSKLKDKDYIEFYKELYPSRPEPLFWIHLNIDMPFTFKGILYFPAFDPQKPIFEHKHLSLYSNRVFVTDNVEGILPEYLSLLHGIIDSPDIPLNVSRSFLQSDPNVKKISTHISNKVISSLKSLMKKDRAKYEEKWDTIKLFINLGVVTIPDLYKKCEPILLLTDIDDNKYTIDEYYEKVKDNQTDKNGRVVYLYTYNKNVHYTYTENLIKLGYNILVFNDQYASYEIQAYEMGLQEKKVTFKRIDSDTAENIILKEDNKHKELSSNKKSMLQILFESSERKLDGFNMMYDVQALGKDEYPATVIANEYFRRIKEMSVINNQGYFIDQDDAIMFIINSDAKLIKKILKNAEKAIGEEITKINADMSVLNKKKDTEENEETKQNLEKEIDTKLEEKKKIIAEYAKTDEHINELIDIALLQYGLLYGENLSNFIKRSYKMLGR